jgi:hypothetical protein
MAGEPTFTLFTRRNEHGEETANECAGPLRASMGSKFEAGFFSLPISLWFRVYHEPTGMAKPKNRITHDDYPDTEKLLMINKEA